MNKNKNSFFFINKFEVCRSLIKNCNIYASEYQHFTVKYFDKYAQFLEKYGHSPQAKRFVEDLKKNAIFANFCSIISSLVRTNRGLTLCKNKRYFRCFFLKLKRLRSKCLPLAFFYYLGLKKMIFSHWQKKNSYTIKKIN